jgi:hypothetical protein
VQGTRLNTQGVVASQQRIPRVLKIPSSTVGISRTMSEPVPGIERNANGEPDQDLQEGIVQNKEFRSDGIDLKSLRPLNIQCIDL